MLRQQSVLDMFARSPLRPLQTHIHKAHACVELLWPFFQAVQQGDWQTADNSYEKIKVLENKADDIKRDLCLHLPKGLFLPVSRGDLLVLLAKQELLANMAKDIAGIMLGRKMQFPPELFLPVGEYLRRCIDASSRSRQAVDELDELLESGFRGKEVKVVSSIIQDLNVIEHETDVMQRRVRKTLFEIEKSLEPIDVMFLYKIIEWIGALADNAQQVGYQLQLLLAD